VTLLNQCFTSPAAASRPIDGKLSRRIWPKRIPITGSPSHFIALSAVERAKL
jgi:hypothetical protein